MMRISPLGIFGAKHELLQVSKWAQRNAALTHPHPVCVQANALFAMAIAFAVGTGNGAPEVYEQIKTWATDMEVQAPLMKAVIDAATSPPADYVHQQGWVLIAFQNALWQLLHSTTLEHGVVDTVMLGGDTDTNAAIAGALLGAVHGLDDIPAVARNAAELSRRSWATARASSASRMLLACGCPTSCPLSTCGWEGLAKLDHGISG